MSVHPEHRLLSALGPVWLAAVASVGFPAPARAIVPDVVFVEAASVNNSASPKVAVAQCPLGRAVLGGTAAVKGEEGQVAIQAAFPVYDAGLARHIFVVKAAEDLSGTIGSWSVSAGAYCIDSVVPLYVTQSSLYDSDSIKSASVTCPMNMRVIGMGAEASTVPDPPNRLVSTTPPLGVVVQGFEVDQDLTTVTANATEVDAALNDSWAGNWQITAVAACAFPLYFDGLERVSARDSAGLLATDVEVRVDLGCPAGKRVIAAGSRNKEPDMGHWYLDRLSRYNAVTEKVVGEAFRNAGVSRTTQFLYAICTDN